MVKAIPDEILLHHGVVECGEVGVHHGISIKMRLKSAQGHLMQNGMFQLMR
jgi:hypothetical protein